MAPLPLSYPRRNSPATDAQAYFTVARRVRPASVSSVSSRGKGGRGKTDVCDAQWLQYLHACGLLRASHRPPAQVCTVRCVLRHRERTVRAAAASIQHLQ